MKEKDIAEQAQAFKSKLRADGLLHASELTIKDHTSTSAVLNAFTVQLTHILRQRWWNVSAREVGELVKQQVITPNEARQLLGVELFVEPAQPPEKIYYMAGRNEKDQQKNGGLLVEQVRDSVLHCRRCYGVFTGRNGCPHCSKCANYETVDPKKDITFQVALNKAEQEKNYDAMLKATDRTVRKCIVCFGVYTGAAYCPLCDGTIELKDTIGSMACVSSKSTKPRKTCGISFASISSNYMPCTRDAGHPGPCAHPFK